MNLKAKILIQIILFGGILIGSYWLGNYASRANFWLSFGIYLSLGIGMVLVYSISAPKTNWKFIFLIGLLIRLSFLTSLPNFSEDFARFLWDGHLLKEGKNPYLNTPEEIMQTDYLIDIHFSEALYEQLNSPEYHSVYPPLHQAIFWFASWIGSDSIISGIVMLRVVLIVGEIIVFFFFLKLFEQFQIQVRNLWLYWINPFVILEITGNLHFEGLVLLFLLAMLYLLTQLKWGYSGFAWGLSIGIKLLPFILFPALFFYSQTKRSFLFWAGVFGALVFSFLVLLINSSWFYLGESIQLYQGKFEFNASIYYLLREVGFWTQGYNMIAELTFFLSLLTMGLIFYMSWNRHLGTVLELIDLFVLIYFVYLIFQPVVHPWYLIPGFGLSLFTCRKIFLAWTCVIFLSYQAYSNLFYFENPFFLGIEYGVVFVFFGIDYFLLKRKTNLM